MKKMPTISVIMPVYNAGEYIENSVKSILTQSFSDIEIICVNDCSKDDSLEKLQKLSAEDERVKVIALEKNVGAGGARNAGLAVAAGEYITFVDADDVIESTLYQKAAACMEEEPDQIVWGLVEEHYNEKGEIVKNVVITPNELKITDSKDLVKEILKLEEKTLFGYQWNSLYKAKIIKEHSIKIEDALFYEDYFFNLEFAKHMETLTTLNFVGYHYAKRPNNSITHQFTKNYFDLSYRRIESMYDFCKERGFFDKYLYDMLGSRLLRYTLSAVCRNLSEKSGMNAADRKNWFLNVCDMELYRSLLSECTPSNAVYSAVKFALNHKCSGLAYAMGRLINLLG